MKPVDLVRKLRRDAAYEPAALDRGKELLMAAIRAGVVGHSMVEFGDSVIGIGTQGAHGAFSPKTAGTASHYISVYIDDIDAHYQRALAAGAQIASAPHAHRTDYRAYEALDLEGHRWRFVQWLREVPIH